MEVILNKIVRILTFILCLISPFSLYAQQEQSKNSQVSSVSVSSAAPTVVYKGSPSVVPIDSNSNWLSGREFWMSVGVLIFGAFLFLIEIVVIKIVKFRPEQAIRLFSVTLILISTLLIITAGFSGDQIAPAMGLLGTIAGYIVGRSSVNEVQEIEK